MRVLRGVFVASLLAATVLAGCFGNGSDDATLGDGARTPVTDRHLQPFNVTGAYSHTLTEGVYDILEPLSQYVSVELPLEELGGNTDPEGPRVHMGLWLPDVPAGTKVPVIADVGPYYSDGDVGATTPANRLGGFLIENFVPHGYAVAQVSVFGTGLANHCMDLMGRSEQLGIDAAVTWLGSQDWSNGKVGLIGRSYDGSTPWEAAMFGNEHLATIVPISGLIGAKELMWRNGSAETRGPIMHNVVYGTFGIDTPGAVDPAALIEGDAMAAIDPTRVDPGDVQTVCPDYMAGPLHGGAAYLFGSEPVESYWAERYFLDEVLANYKGSVFLIHGMQDWNVDPHMAFPTHQRVEEAGLEIKGLYGQWAHNYPDRISEHDGCGRCHAPESVRLDWAQDLLEWFDYYLMGTGPKPALHVEIQDDQGAWRIEETYPPRDVEWLEIPLGENTEGTVGQHPVSGLTPLGFAGDSITLTFGPFEEDLRIAGLPTLPLTVTPEGPGGQVFAELRDKDQDRHIGHAVMDIRYHAGGDQMQTVVPGETIVMQMEFFALDAVLPAGHALELRLTQTGEDYLAPAVSAPVQVHVNEQSNLRLPVLDASDRVFFTPPVPVIEDA